MRPPRTVSSFVIVSLLLVAGVEPNPGPSSSSSIGFGLVNARSAVKKAALVHDLIADLRLEVLMLTESWITSDAPDSIKLDIAPPGFQVVHQPRGPSSGKRGGGIAIIHRNAIKVRRIDVGAPTEFEVLALNISPRPSVQIVVACLYRPPGNVSDLFCTQLADLFDQLITIDKRFVVCGDFNCPGVDDNLIDNNLDDVLQRYDLVQHVRSPTHVDGNTLDLLLTSSSEVSLLSDINVSSTCFSDHHAVACRLGITSNHPSIMH